MWFSEFAEIVTEVWKITGFWHSRTFKPRYTRDHSSFYFQLKCVRNLSASIVQRTKSYIHIAHCRTYLAQIRMVKFRFKTAIFQKLFYVQDIKYQWSVKKNKMESMCFRRSKRYLYWRTKTWIDLFEVLLAHAEMRIAEISKENYEFSKIMHFQSHILKQSVKDFDINPGALESWGLDLSYAQGFRSISCKPYSLVLE